jgi:RpiB/LacA/LacB family sugar-phosphate isomerase
MRVAIGCDHRGFRLKASLLAALEADGHAVLDLGTFSEDTVDYPDFARAVGHAVIRGFVEAGVLVCGSGVGAAVAANKIRGVRAALCADAEMARQSRDHLDANVLCLGAMTLDQEQAAAITRAWLATGFSREERHARRIAKIAQMEVELPAAASGPATGAAPRAQAPASAPAPPPAAAPPRASRAEPPAAPTTPQPAGVEAAPPIPTPEAPWPGRHEAAAAARGQRAQVEEDSLTARASKLIEQAFGKLDDEAPASEREGVIALDDADLDVPPPSPRADEARDRPPAGAGARRGDAPPPRAAERAAAPKPGARAAQGPEGRAPAGKPVAAVPAAKKTAGAAPPPGPDLAALPEVEQALRALDEQNFLDRIWVKDGTLWKGDAGANRNRLGWLTAPTIMREQAGDLKGFADEIRRLQFTHVLLLGMGGSSLAAEVFATTFGSRMGYPDLLMLDSTDPSAVKKTLDRINLAKTLVIVSTKSGTTTETLALYAFFRATLEATKSPKPGMQFVAITDPGSPLEQLARDAGFRRTFLNPASIGGRYSALSFFGLVPAALIGVDVKALLARADAMVQRCTDEPSVQDNPGARLGATLAGLARSGRDKLTLVLSPEIRAFGAWAEQLLAESLGKDGLGVVPVDGEPLAAPEAYGNDRVFVALTVGADASSEGALAALAAGGHPVIPLALGDPVDLGAEFFRWEFATAAAGAVLGVNPFDEPDVATAKERTAAVLAEWKKSRKPPEWPVACEEDGLALIAAGDERPASLTDALRAHLALARPGDYVGIQAYLAPSPDTAARLLELRTVLRDRLRVATTLGYGPRYLHSTGQLHKGGPNTGVFIQLTADDREDVAIPGAGYGFSTLKAAQAQGDLQALRDGGRRVLRLHLRGQPGSALDALVRRARRAGAGP